MSAYESAPAGVRLDLPSAARKYDYVLVDQLHRTRERPPPSVTFRSHEQIARFCDTLEPVAPGLIDLTLWRPEDCDDLIRDETEPCLGRAAVGRKPYVSAA